MAISEGGKTVKNDKNTMEIVKKRPKFHKIRPEWIGFYGLGGGGSRFQRTGPRVGLAISEGGNPHLTPPESPLNAQLKTNQTNTASIVKQIARQFKKSRANKS